jgi:hypothetical protein
MATIDKCDSPAQSSSYSPSPSLRHATQSHLTRNFPDRPFVFHLFKRTVFVPFVFRLCSLCVKFVFRFFSLCVTFESLALSHSSSRFILDFLGRLPHGNSREPAYSFSTDGCSPIPMPISGMPCTKQPFVVPFLVRREVLPHPRTLPIPIFTVRLSDAFPIPQFHAQGSNDAYMPDTPVIMDAPPSGAEFDAAHDAQEDEDGEEEEDEDWKAEDE